MRKVYRLVREYTPGKVVEKVEIEETSDEVIVERGGSVLRLPKSSKEVLLREGMSVSELFRIFESFPSLSEVLGDFGGFLLPEEKKR